MQVTLTSTDRIVELEIDGRTVPARVWVGRTAAGIECHAYITRIAVARSADAAEFEAALRETHDTLPLWLAGKIPTRLVLA